MTVPGISTILAKAQNAAPQTAPQTLSVSRHAADASAPEDILYGSAGLQARKISNHFIAVARNQAEKINGQIIIDNNPYIYYRDGAKDNGQDRGEVLYRRADIPLAALAAEDMQEVNRLCEQIEGKQNRAAKAELTAALSAHFNKQAAHITEFGPGYHPLLTNIKAASPKNGRIKDPSYLGIDVDEKAVDTLRSTMDIPATTWNDAAGHPLPEGRPAVAVGVYSLHFMVDQSLPEKIMQHTSAADGFYAGNFYIDPSEKISGESRAQLASILDQHNMSYIRLQNPKLPTSEYWIISRADPESMQAADRFAQTLQKETKRVCQRTLERIENAAGP